jgi:hypothetical protein
MKQSLVVLVLIAVALQMPSRSQTKHAPLPEQCIADFNLWFATSSYAGIESLGMSVLDQREAEMWDCASAAKAALDEEHGVTYRMEMLGLSNVYTEHKAHRMFDYLNRHGELQQFVKEDTEGKR